MWTKCLLRLQIIIHVCEHLGMWFHLTTLLRLETCPSVSKLGKTVAAWKACMQQNKTPENITVSIVQRCWKTFLTRSLDSCSVYCQRLQIESSQCNLSKYHTAPVVSLPYLPIKQKLEKVWCSRDSSCHMHGMLPMLTAQRMLYITFKSRCRQLSVYCKVYYDSGNKVLDTCSLQFKLPWQSLSYPMHLTMPSASLIGALEFESDTVPVEAECHIRWVEPWAGANLSCFERPNGWAPMKVHWSE